MKTKTLLLVLVAILIISCAPEITIVSPTQSDVVLSTFTPLPPMPELLQTETRLLPTASISTISPTPMQEMLPLALTAELGFIEPDPETWVLFMHVVREYLYYRKLAVIAGDVEVLWKRYPALKNGVDVAKGVNAEEFFIKNMQIIKPFDGNISPEGYERMKVKVSGETAEVLIHRMELYLCLDEYGKFEDSGGEFKEILFLIRQGNQWTVEKTQDISGP